MIRVLSIVGTRPEAIKMAPVILELARRRDQFESKVCATGQHGEMLDRVLDLFRIRPDYDLEIMRPDQTLTDVTAAVLRGLEPVLRAERPDWVLVQGDTTTVMAASLAAFYQHVRVGHVEAGLRTHDRDRPFPEEVHRRITTVLADLHFAPTARAADNLRREGIPAGRIEVTGNTVIDAIQHAAGLAFDPAGSPLAGLPAGPRPIVLVTAHRRENFGAGLESICGALQHLALHHDVHLVYPVHPNPRIHGPVHRLLGDVPNVTLLPPLEYLPLVWLLKRCRFVITDSGGLQEEAPGLGKPVLVLRDTTERPEAVDAGTVRLVGTDFRRIVDESRRLLEDHAAYAAMARAHSPYGDGRAGGRIAEALAARPPREGEAAGEPRPGVRSGHSEEPT